MALLSVFVMSLSGIVLSFSGDRINALCRISKLFRWLTFLAIGTTMAAFVVSFALIVVGGSKPALLIRCWGAGVVVLCVFLMFRTLLELAIFVYSLRRSISTHKRAERAGYGEEGIDSDDVKRDSGAYDNLWDGAIKPKIDLLCECGDVQMRPSAKDDIWAEYCRFNVLASERYTKNPSHRLDRHKVAACYMCAILKSMPLVVADYAALSDRDKAMSNERLAVTVGSSVLCNFLHSVIDEVEGLDEAQKEAAKVEVRQGIKFPKTGHGTYLGNLLDCFSSMQTEDDYNLPLMFHLAFLWEPWILTTPEYYAAVIDHYASNGNEEPLPSTGTLMSSLRRRGPDA